MEPESACALLYKLGDIRTTMTGGGPPPGQTFSQAEKEIIVVLLTELLHRVPTYSEIQAATFSP